MNIILDNIAIWTPKLGDELTVRTTPAGAKHQDATTNLISLTDKTVYRYAKNYKTKGRNGVRFCLFVRTYSDDAKDIEKQLDDYATKIATNEVADAIAKADSTKFVYTNKYLEVK